MAQIKPLKVGSTGLDTEMDTASDDLTAASFTAGAGPVVSATGIDFNGTDIVDIDDISFTAPSTDGLTQTAGVLACDNIMGKERSNTMTTAADILFPVISDSVGQVDAFRLPALAGTPTATPTASGEGFAVWDSTNDLLYLWNGAAWVTNYATASTSSSIDVSYTAGAGGINIRDAVYVSAADTVLIADANAESTSRVIGFAVASASAAASVTIRSKGVLTGFTGLTAGARYYLSETTGGITATPPTTASANIIMVGYAKSTTALDICIVPMSVRAA